MSKWRAVPGTKTDAHTHTVATGLGHALLAPLASHVFRVVGISAALRAHGQTWFPIHNHPDVMAFERAHAATTERSYYNDVSCARAARKKKVLRAEHAGFCDLFAPIVLAGEVVGTLVTGPFLRKPPSGPEILKRWRELTGRPGHLNDLEFTAYVSATLSTPVLDERKLASFERVLYLLSLLMTAQRDAGELMNEIERLQVELSELRFPERSWAAAREMVDERFMNTWRSQVGSLQRFGMSKVADQVLVGLTLSRGLARDPVDEGIRRHALQSRAAAFARSARDVIAGQVGDNGIVFLSCASGPIERRKQKLLDLAEKVTRYARRELELSLHFGASVPLRSESLNLTYRAALGAAEAALTRGGGLLWAEASGSLPSLRELRKELGQAIERGPESLTLRFDRYLEAVAAHCAYRLEGALGHVEAGFERIAEPLVGVGTLDAKSFSLMAEKLERAAGEAQSLTDLFAAYRRAIADLTDAIQKPGSARQDRSLRVALDYIHQHYTEPLRLTEVARRSGFASSHFSKLFIKREQVSFQHYVRRLRVERAKHLLANTDLALGRIAELTGFGNNAYFCRVFRESTGGTPLAHRNRTIALRSSGNERFPRNGKTTRNASQDKKSRIQRA